MSARRRVNNIDRHVGYKINERRRKLGLTQVELGDLLGVSYQQVHKYTSGINRISAGRLYEIAQALSIAPGYFFEGLTDGAVRITPQQRMLLELTHNFVIITELAHKEALLQLSRALASGRETE